MNIELLSGAVVVGLGATIFMDVCAELLKRAFGVPTADNCTFGRWLCHMVDGNFTHPDIDAAAEKPAECAVGWIAHYITGVVFGIAFVALAADGWLQSPTLIPAVIFGIVTVGFPFLIMHPAFGLGVAASKVPNPLQARLRSLMNHTLFGLGLYVSGLVLSSVFKAYTA